jgi:5'(3')-deoxyribonucleotidase
MTKEKPTIYCDMDGVVAGFAQGYKEHFERDVYKDDSFTVNRYVLQKPHFFRGLPIIEKGAELVDLLKDEYRVVFLTTPMEGMDQCKRDKIDWIKEHFGIDYNVIFSDNKAEYVIDEKSVLIDDMNYNLEPWREAGGTAINIRNSIDRIFEIIEEAVHGIKTIKNIKGQISKIKVDPEPTEKQKESGNYKKGKITFKAMEIMIENVPGSIRFGWDDRGRKWVQRMKHYYGYIKGTEGNDYDPVDCFIGDKLNASRAFIVNQAKEGLFDEVKCMLGFEDIEEAKAAYLSNYQKGWEKNIISIIPTNTKHLREWLSLRSKEPFK